MKRSYSHSVKGVIFYLYGEGGCVAVLILLIFLLYILDLMTKGVGRSFWVWFIFGMVLTARFTNSEQV